MQRLNSTPKVTVALQGQTGSSKTGRRLLEWNWFASTVMDHNSITPGLNINYSSYSLTSDCIKGTNISCHKFKTSFASEVFSFLKRIL